jgi:hypothetical protein
MNKNKKLSEFDYILFVEEYNKDIRFLYQLFPNKIKDIVPIERFMYFCYICS